MDKILTLLLGKLDRKVDNFYLATVDPVRVLPKLAKKYLLILCNRSYFNLDIQILNNKNQIENTILKKERLL